MGDRKKANALRWVLRRIFFILLIIGCVTFISGTTLLLFTIFEQPDTYYTIYSNFIHMVKVLPTFFKVIVILFFSTFISIFICTSIYKLLRGKKSECDDFIVS